MYRGHGRVVYVVVPSMALAVPVPRWLRLGIGRRVRMPVAVAVAVPMALVLAAGHLSTAEINTRARDDLRKKTAGVLIDL